jgi:hypothetical protein
VLHGWIKKLVNKILEEPICRYSKGCPYFNEEAYTCNHDDEASSGYCGRFRMIEGCNHKRCITKLTGYDTVAIVCKECGYKVARGTIHELRKSKSESTI